MMDQKTIPANCDNDRMLREGLYTEEEKEKMRLSMYGSAGNPINESESGKEEKIEYFTD